MPLLNKAEHKLSPQNLTAALPKPYIKWKVVNDKEKLLNKDNKR